MNIGIIGTGAIGATLAQKLVAAGHQVKVTNTDSPEALAQKAQGLGARPATIQEVVQDVEAVVISVPTTAIPELPKDLFQGVPADVVVVDTSNYYPFRDGQIDALVQGQVESEWVAEHLGRPVIKAFNNLLAETLANGGTAPGTPGRIAQAIAGDDEAAKQLVIGLSNDAGFDAVDAGPLAESWRQQPGTPAYCTELTAPELPPALAAANKAEAPQRRELVVSQLMQRTSPPSHAEVLAINRGLHPTNPKQG
jgi:predicted dinucleotide-binding enzyme